MLFKTGCQTPGQSGLQQLVFPDLACILHFITSSKSFRAVCNRDLTVPAGIPSTAPTSPASISSTKESCKTLRSCPGKHSISLRNWRSEEHTSELQSQSNLVCRLLLEKKKNNRHETNSVYP